MRGILLSALAAAAVEISEAPTGRGPQRDGSRASQDAAVSRAETKRARKAARRSASAAQLPAEQSADLKD